MSTRQKTFCSWEQVILDCFKQGNLNPEHKKHLKDCSVCRDSVMVNSWMKNFKKTSTEDEIIEKKVPDFELIWQGAKSYRKYDKELEKKALLPLLIPKIFTFVVAVIGMIVLLTANTDKIKDFVAFKLKMGYLFDLLALVGKNLLALMPFLIIPIIIILSFMAFYFLFSIFKPKKIPEQ